MLLSRLCGYSGNGEHAQRQVTLGIRTARRSSPRAYRTALVAFARKQKKQKKLADIIVQEEMQIAAASTLRLRIFAGYGICCREGRRCCREYDKASRVTCITDSYRSGESPGSVF